MTWPEHTRAWTELVDAQKSCRLCATECASPLIQSGARPLFGRFKVWKSGVLFLFEAPNWDDTFDEDKGYLTDDRETDPSGRMWLTSASGMPAPPSGVGSVRGGQQPIRKPLAGVTVA